jgi:hypothetical protein
MDRAAARRVRLAWYALLALALLVATYLRASQLDTQILLDDEWHAIHKLLRADARDIATHFGLADYSIPLTLYYRALYLFGGLTEFGMRLPMLLAGIALIALGPWLLRRHASTATLALWSALMAISPLMVYHSRTARPYAVTTLLVFVALIAFRAWWLGGRRRWAVAYIACMILAGWLHLIALPFTLLPFIFFGMAALVRWRAPDRCAGWRGLLRLCLLGLPAALLLAVALLPPFLNDWAALAGKAGGGAVSFDTLYRGLLLMFGVSQPLPCAVLMLLVAVGIASWSRRDVGFVGYIAFVMIGTGAAIAASHAAWLQHPGTYARYMQPAVPFLLLFAAEGFSALTAPFATGRIAAGVQVALAAALPIGLLVLGPIPGYWYAPNQFMEHPYFQFDYDAAHNPYRTQLPDGPVPDFYRQLAKQPARSLTLIEAPWSLETDHDPQPLYQRVHRQMIKIGLVTPVCGQRDYGEYPEDPGMRLRQFAHLSALLRGEAAGDLLVMHMAPWPDTLPPPPQWPDIAQCLASVEQALGAPQYRDAQIAVFGLSPAGRDVLRALYPAQQMQ